MAIQSELGSKQLGSQLFNHSFEVLAHVTQTRDEDIRQALLEHIEQEAEDGKKITQQEITALKKALAAEQARVGPLSVLSLGKCCTRAIYPVDWIFPESVLNGLTPGRG